MPYYPFSYWINPNKSSCPGEWDAKKGSCKNQGCLWFLKGDNGLDSRLPVLAVGLAVGAGSGVPHSEVARWG